MFVIFDLDGTIADISHRVHFVRGGGRPDWRAFFDACSDDKPVGHVIDTLYAHIEAGHHVEIWSARSDAVRDKTEAWLNDVAGIDAGRLTRMRVAGDNTPDDVLKRHWLLHADMRPDIVYDDRQRVVDMWRAEGVPCFQVVADWDSDNRKIAPTRETLLTILVGPSGAGKSTWCGMHASFGEVISSDQLRALYCGDFRSQARNDDVFTALHRLAKARLDCGLPVTIDATNLRRRDRLACAALAPHGTRVRYIVVDRPLEDKMRSGGWRNDVIIGGKTLVEVHHERMQSVLRDVLSGDGLPFVDVVDWRRENVASGAA